MIEYIYRKRDEGEILVTVRVLFAIKVYFDIKISAQLETRMNPKNDEPYDLKAKQRFQQPRSGRVSPGIASEVTQDTERYRFSGLLVVTPCLLCMHGLRCRVQPALDKPLQNQLFPIRESGPQISAQHNINGQHKKLAFEISEMR